MYCFHPPQLEDPSPQLQRVREKLEAEMLLSRAWVMEGVLEVRKAPRALTSPTLRFASHSRAHDVTPPPCSLPVCLSVCMWRDRPCRPLRLCRPWRRP